MLRAIEQPKSLEKPWKIRIFACDDAGFLI